jgi:hypothetical protein
MDPQCNLKSMRVNIIRQVFTPSLTLPLQGGGKIIKYIFNDETKRLWVIAVLQAI